MVRKLSWLVALSALWCSMGAFALGLGDIDLHSALNQPINADIDLLAVRTGEAEGIKVTLGTAEDFARAGLERPYWLTQLRFLLLPRARANTGFISPRRNRARAVPRLSDPSQLEGWTIAP